MNSIDLNERVAVVTGGAKGIGFAIVERFLASGAKVALWDRDQGALDAAKASFSNGKTDRIVTCAVDVTDATSIEKARAETKAALGTPAILVNSAGITGGNMPVWEMTPENWRQVIDVNLTGTFLTCRALVKDMIDAGYGRIVNIASIAGKEGNPNAAHYSASKAGVIGLTKSLGKETATSGVVVNCITPAAVRTEIFDQMTEQHINFMLSKIPMGRFGLVEEIAALVAWLSSPDCAFSTGAVFDISGGRGTY